MTEFSVVVWRTGKPYGEYEMMVTCQDQNSRWVIPGCKFDGRQWWYKAIEPFEMPTGGPDDGWETVPERWEKLYAKVIAWAEYPDPYKGAA